MATRRLRTAAELACARLDAVGGVESKRRRQRLIVEVSDLLKDADEVQLLAVQKILVSGDEPVEKAKLSRQVVSYGGGAPKGVPQKFQFEAIMLASRKSKRAVEAIPKSSLEEVFLLGNHKKADDVLPERRMDIEKFYEAYAEQHEKCGSPLSAIPDNGKPLDWTRGIGIYAVVYFRQRKTWSLMENTITGEITRINIRGKLMDITE